MKHLKSIAWPALFTIATALAVILCLQRGELEMGHYSAFCRSLVEDGDLNIVNQVGEADRWLVTKTHNHPVHVSHGAPVLWLPFCAGPDLLFSGSLRARLTILGLDSYQVFGVIRNLFFLAVSLIFLRAAVPTSARSLGGLLLVFFIGTPLAWFALFEPFNAEITVFFLGALLAYQLVRRPPAASSPIEVFAYGLFVGFGMVVKAHFLLFAFPIGLELLRQRRSPRALLFPLGMAVPLGLLLVNNHFQSGGWPLLHHLNLLDYLRSSQVMIHQFLFLLPNSIFSLTPLLLLATAVAAWQFARVRGAGPIGTMSFVILLHVAAVVFFFWRLPVYPDLLSSRILLVMVPFCVLLGALIPETSKRQRAVFVLLVGCALIHFLQTTQYAVTGMVLRFPGFGNVLPFFELLAARLRYAAVHTRELADLVWFLPALLVLSWILKLLQERTRSPGALAKIFTGFAIGSVALYAGVTAINSFRNPANAEALWKSGYLSRSVVSGGLALNYYDEVISSLKLGIDHLPAPQAADARRARAAYVETAMSQVLLDPIGVVERWRAGTPRPSLWDDYRDSPSPVQPQNR